MQNRVRVLRAESQIQFQTTYFRELNMDAGTIAIQLRHNHLHLQQLLCYLSLATSGECYPIRHVRRLINCNDKLTPFDTIKFATSIF